MIWAETPQEKRLKQARTTIENTLGCEPNFTLAHIPSKPGREEYVLKHEDGDAYVVAIEPIDDPWPGH